MNNPTLALLGFLVLMFGSYLAWVQFKPIIKRVISPPSAKEIAERQLAETERLILDAEDMCEQADANLVRLTTRRDRLREMVDGRSNVVVFSDLNSTSGRFSAVSQK